MISVLLPTYNGEKYLGLAIESVLNQSFKDFELLIAFNGTTDNSKHIPLKYNDPRVRIFDYGDDVGKSKTLNKLLLEAKYDWIALQDDDDHWIFDKLENQLTYINDFDVIGTFIYYIDEYGNITRSLKLSSDHNSIVYLSMAGKNQIANTSAIFKKQDALEINGWKEGLDGIEDFDFWLRLMRQGKKFINIPEFLVQHRIHKDSKFNTKIFDIKKIL